MLLWDIATGSYRWSESKSVGVNLGLVFLDTGRSAGPVALQNHEGNVSSCEISHNGE